MRKVMSQSWALKKLKGFAWTLDLDERIILTFDNRPTMVLSHLSDEDVEWWKQQNPAAAEDKRWEFFLNMRGKSHSTPVPEPSVEPPTAQPSQEEIAALRARNERYDREAREWRANTPTKR
jgi:hypothetical protein